MGYEYGLSGCISAIRSDNLYLPDDDLICDEVDYYNSLYNYLCRCIDDNNDLIIIKNILESTNERYKYDYDRFLYSNDKLLLKLSYSKGNIELFKYLITLYNKDDLDVNDSSILYSAYNGRIDFIKFFIEMFKDKINENTIENIIKYLLKSFDKDAIEYGNYLLNEKNNIK